ncbi:hypothetical protein ACS0TY_023233 [Phlomoides rotata]
MFAGLDESVLAMNLNFVFTGGEYNGSSLCILGRNPIDSKNRELPVVGGTSVFRMESLCDLGFCKLSWGLGKMNNGAVGVGLGKMNSGAVGVGLGKMNNGAVGVDLGKMNNGAVGVDLGKMNNGAVGVGLGKMNS